MPDRRTSLSIGSRPVYFTPDRGLSYPRVSAEQTKLYDGFKQKSVLPAGYSSVAAGWSQDVVAECWSLPSTEGYENRMLRHRLVVAIGSAPPFLRWDDDGDLGEGKLRPGAINLMPQGLTSRTTWTADLDVVTFEFSSSLMSRLLDGRESNASSEQLLPRRNVPDWVAHYLACAVMTELSHPTERLYGEMLCLTLAMHMLRTYGRARIDAVTGRLSPVQARHALEYIHANLHDDLSVHALAREAGLSEAHFARAFRATFNEAPHRLVLRWRLERAMRLIKLNNFSLADAAAAAGFYDQSHFSNAVRRHFATSPGSIFTL